MKKFRVAMMAFALMAGASTIAMAQGGGARSGRQGGARNQAARYFAKTSVARVSAFLVKANEVIAKYRQ
jgi:hypothetical protein